MQGDKGMTLMELLVVISILGLLVTVMLPFQGRMADNTKREETIQLLESIRFALLGAENAYDANGNRVLGGYVGDYGTLPKFVVHQWDSSSNTLLISEDSSNPGTPEELDWEDAAMQNYHDASIMPLNLWVNTVRIGSSGTAYEFMDSSDWNGPYIAMPRDDFTSDDDLYSYTAPDASTGVHTDESRHFLLRQGEGRLTDGWGSAIHIYFDDDENLYFVSAGSDRRMSFGNEPASSAFSPNLGPADLRLPHNDDNLVLMISREQWNLKDQKIATTRQQIKDLKSALLGRYGSVTDGVNQPNGFIADMGSFELLTGSYVRYGSTVYKCIDSHETPAGGSFSASHWVAVTGGATGKDVTDFPFAGEWVAERFYYEENPYLLVISGDYVKFSDKYYRCVKDNTSSGQNPEDNPDMWVEDDTFKGHALVPLYDSAKEYEKETVSSWKYYINVKFGAGWRGPYTAYSDTPLTDAWGKDIQLKLDDAGGLIIYSMGPDTLPDTTDDILENIQRSDYVVPVTVTVKAEASMTTQSSDYVAVFTAFNGKVAAIYAKNQALTVGLGRDGLFPFTDAVGEVHAPVVVANGNEVITTSPAGTIDWYDTTDAVGLPMGRVTVVYQNGTTGAYSSPVGFQETYIIHPRTNPELRLGD